MRSLAPPLARNSSKRPIPKQKQMASRMLDFPEPFRPVMALKVGSQPVMTVRTAYDLKPSIINSVILMVGGRGPVGACYGVKQQIIRTSLAVSSGGTSQQ